MAEAPILQIEVPKRRFDLGQALRASAAARRISPVRLTAEILRRRFGRQRLSVEEYFTYGAHRAGLTPAERDAFIGDALGYRMCAALSGTDNSGLSGLLRDKLLCDLVLSRVGLPVASIRAVAQRTPLRLPYPLLTDAASVTRFLDHEAVLPVFGKPSNAFQSIGATSILSRPAPGRLTLGDGRDVSSAQFGQEVFRHFPDGFLFQEMLRPHPEMEAMTGPVVATARLVTLRVGKDVILLYGGIKSPGKGAMVDGSASLSTIEAAVDPATARVTRAQDPYRLGGNDLAANPVTGVQMIGRQVPDWAAAVKLALEAHRLFPTLGVIGGDIALTPEGPVIVELNSRPGMSFYQKVNARGLWNSELAPRLTEALAEVGHRHPTRDLPLPWRVAA